MLLILIHLMVAKRLQVIALAAFLLIKRHKKGNVGFDHGFNGGKKKAVTTFFLRNF